MSQITAEYLKNLVSPAFAIASLAAWRFNFIIPHLPFCAWIKIIGKRSKNALTQRAENDRGPADFILGQGVQSA
jgi:hypothetical protein